MQKLLKNYLNKHQGVKDFLDHSKKAAHLSDIQESLLIYGAHLQTQAPLFILKENDVQVENLKNKLLSLNSDLKVYSFTHEESLRIEAIASSDYLKYERILALNHLIKKDYDIFITTGISAIRKISPKETLKENTLTLKVNQEIAPKDLINHLESMGYSRVKYVERPLTYATRGGIIDVYSVEHNHPLRFEFFDVEIDSIRTFDINTQRSIETIDEVEVLFASEVLLNDHDITQIQQNMTQALNGASDELQEEMLMQFDLIQNMQYDDSHYPYLSFWDNYATILDYTKEVETFIFPKANILLNIKSAIEDMVEFIQERVENELFVKNYDLYANISKIKSLEGYVSYEFQNEDSLHLPWHLPNIVSDDLNNTLKVIKKEAIDHRVILSVDEDKYETLINALLNKNINYENFTQQTKPGIYLSLYDLDAGFVLDDIKTIVYSEKELFMFKHKTYRYDEAFFKQESLHRLNDLDTFDYVVHRQYGIGKYMGISTREIDGIKKDFMRIQYRDGDELFVPLEQFNLVRKYISSEAVAIRLSKLGSNTWRKNKERIQENINDVADKLLDIYTKRSQTKGYQFSQDTEYQIKFEEEFKYQLTPDQQIAIDEIKSDMESETPMDRLLCGDVGFGKTEVAIRAAFKAIVDEKQAIFLCPTTILSSQHYKTFKERFKNYPITIEVLNRFVSPLKQKEILKRFKEGNVDILIGTHRVLSKDVKAHDLGLLIIDEEQRFGVEHKERIKEYKVNVDVLSLSATPIPRTLQMSLIGIRSLSQLNTPPSNRLPVMTYVIERNPKTIYDVIQKEINRDGQAFYLFNNVSEIYQVATTIKQNIPDAKVAVVHGQMSREEIEDVMLRFIEKEVNVLVTTTIIETGIDIPNANTILVDNAHRFGLSQLYQIKGRVGRSDRLAYAYFIVPEKQNLTEVATKRLQAIKEFTQLGSGYKIAMRDLTIRGAGDLLGGNQSGFIDSIGIDLYVELLNEAIELRQGKKVKQEKPKPQLNIEGYLPGQFTTDDQEKLDLYQ
ncbi:MAG TPA: transcription-repair coupling factor, partial [Erysipelothrix sp.]|nr:transcription-repair coupling factor [Erysipelothrix sp.]